MLYDHLFWRFVLLRRFFGYRQHLPGAEVDLWCARFDATTSEDEAVGLIEALGRRLREIRGERTALFGITLDVAQVALRTRVFSNATVDACLFWHRPTCAWYLQGSEHRFILQAFPETAAVDAIIDLLAVRKPIHQELVLQGLRCLYPDTELDAATP